MKNKLNNVLLSLDGNATAAAADVLGGTPATAPATPGAAARRRSNAKSGKTKVAKGEKRAYTKRGTTVKAARTVLLDGKPVGQGKPSKEGKNRRMVVYVPVGMKYDEAKHGKGVKFNPAVHAVFRRLPIDKLGYELPVALRPKTGKAKAKAKTVKAKAKSGKAKSGKTVSAVKVAAPAAETPAAPSAPVENPAPVTA